MARTTLNLLELDVDKLFEDHQIEEIVEIGKVLDAEIERKRVDLRSMVGDRYKDVLAASDAIKNMKTISQDIVDNIQRITETCEKLINQDSQESTKQSVVPDSHKLGERILIIQVRLAIFMNEQIWIALDSGDNLMAAQIYLLAQHIHMGLSLSKREHLDRLPLLKQIKSNLATLRSQIFHRIKQKLESVEIIAEETSSNLNALLLLQNQSTKELLNIFIEHRKTALSTVINTTHASVRVQVSAMGSKKGLIWQQLEGIVQASSPATLSKVELPTTPLSTYIPDTIKQFRPKCKGLVDEGLKGAIGLQDWLKSTKESVQKGLENSLKLVTNVKGLHIIREEVLKIELPSEWETICSETNLPEGFNIWFFFFQSLITHRARELVSKKVSSIIKHLENEVTSVLGTSAKVDRNERDLRLNTWVEDFDDVSRVENKHTGLSMKTMGYSQSIVGLCEKLDAKYLELLVDVSQYLFGKEFDELAPNIPPALHDFKTKKKFIDKEELQNHLRIECTNNANLLTVFLQDFVKSETTPDTVVSKSLMCARFLQAVTNLCPHFTKCCSFSGTTDDWIKICDHFNKSGIQFWGKWVDKCVQVTSEDASKQLGSISICTMISILPRWDVIEIQEQTEEKVFKSQIKVPLKPSLALHNILNKLNDDISQVLPHTLPKQIHLQYVESNVAKILDRYRLLLGEDLNQNQALQFLFDVKFLTTFCIPRENVQLVSASQEICDKLRARIDPFDLDVFYSYLQNNVKRAVLQSQVILGCLLPSSGQLANLGVPEKLKDQEKEPSILALSVPSMTSWFPLLPISAPSQKTTTSVSGLKEAKSVTPKPSKATPKKSQDPTAVMRSGAAALFGGLTTDWFS